MWLNARWKLSNPRDARVLFEKELVSRGDASTGDAFVGVTRVRIATERAARKNIELGLSRIAQLRLEAEAWERRTAQSDVSIDDRSAKLVRSNDAK